MKTLIKPLLHAVLLSASMDASARTLHLAIDVSGSNPLLAHENYAYAASQYVAGEIGRLKAGDRVRIQTFGARDNPLNILDANYEIGRRVRPDAVATVVSEFIRDLPKRQDLSQGATNILAWIEFHPSFDCAQGDQILLLSDGIESSSTVSAQALVEGKAALPVPEVQLDGCTLTFYGLGAGLPPAMVRHIRKAWQDWAEQSGAAFQAVIP